MESKNLKPNNVNIGLALVVAGVVIGLIASFLYGIDYARLLGNGKLMFSFLVFTFLYLGVVLALVLSENWARIVFILLQVLTLDSFYQRIFVEVDLYLSLLSSIQFLLYWVGIIYLLTPTANAWFKETTERRKRNTEQLSK